MNTLREKIKNKIEVRLISKGESVHSALVSEITRLVNLAYENGEKGLWKTGAIRTTEKEVIAYISDEELAGAFTEDRIVGCIRMRQLDSSTKQLGMLACEPEFGRLGIGRQLVAFAESKAKNDGNSIMQAELLVPINWTHKDKELLREWYSLNNYKVVKMGELSAFHPHLSPLLCTPCNFIVYWKSI